MTEKLERLLAEEYITHVNDPSLAFDLLGDPPQWIKDLAQRLRDEVTAEMAARGVFRERTS